MLLPPACSGGGSDARQLFDETAQQAQQLIPDTGAHGFDLLTTEPEVGDLVIEWNTNTWN